MHLSSQLVQSMFNRNTLSNAKQVELSPGQVFKGTVVKLYPDNMALVQIGGMQVHAKLEASLEAGQKAWLQVQPSSGVVTLKVLTAPDQPQDVLEANIEGLIRSLGLTDTKESRAIVQALVNANLPVSKELVQTYMQLTKDLGFSDATMEAFLLAMKRNLPLTKDTVAGLKSFLSDQPLTRAIHTFLDQAEQFLYAEKSKGIETIPTTSRLTATPTAAPQGGEVISNGTASMPFKQIVSLLTAKVTSLPLILALPERPQPLPNTTAQTEQQQQQQTKGAPSGNQVLVATDSQPLQPEHRAIQSGQQVSSTTQPTAVTDSSPSSQSQGQVPINKLTAETVASTTVNNPASTPQPTLVAKNDNPTTQKQFVPAQQAFETLPGTVQQSAVVPNGTEQQPLSAHTTQRKGLQSVSGEVPVVEPPSVSADAEKPNLIKELFRQLGMTHERDIMNQGMRTSGAEPATLKQGETIKSLLLQISQAPAHAVPGALREATDSLLQQVTGQQLMLAQPTSQAISQLVMQVPIRTEKGDDTAFVQIEAKKQGGGQLDSENCRLFFNLDLKQIGITMVDVTIINRIVNVQIFNDEPWLETLAQQMKETFTGQLQEVGYQLSNMRVQPIPDAKSKTGSQQPKGGLLSSYKGVDIRV